jgi:hypothetical protein
MFFSLGATFDKVSVAKKSAVVQQQNAHVVESEEGNAQLLA